MNSNPPPQPKRQSQPQYWTISTTPPPSTSLKGLQWHYDSYCRLMWQTVDEAINQSLSDLPAHLKQCLHHTLSHPERKALKSDVLWLLIEQTGVTVDLILDSTDILDRSALVQAIVRLDAIRTVLQAQARR
jgi:hypothetical protein